MIGRSKKYCQYLSSVETRHVITRNETSKYAFSYYALYLLVDASTYFFLKFILPPD